MVVNILDAIDIKKGPLCLNKRVNTNTLSKSWKYLFKENTNIEESKNQTIKPIQNNKTKDRGQEHIKSYNLDTRTSPHKNCKLTQLRPLNCVN